MQRVSSTGSVALARSCSYSALEQALQRAESDDSFSALSSLLSLQRETDKMEQELEEAESTMQGFEARGDVLVLLSVGAVEDAGRRLEHLSETLHLLQDSLAHCADGCVTDRDLVEEYIPALKARLEAASGLLYPLMDRHVAIASLMQLLPPPSNVVAIPGNCSVMIDFERVIDADSYIITQEHTTPDGIIVRGKQCCQDSPVEFNDLTNGATYRFSVAAKSGRRHSEDSTTVECVPMGPPLEPRKITIMSGNTTMAIVRFEEPACTGGAPITKYTVSWCSMDFDDIPVPGHAPAELSASTQSGEVSDARPPIMVELPGPGEYCFSVRAHNCVGEGPNSTDIPYRVPPVRGGHEGQGDDGCGDRCSWWSSGSR